IADAGRPAGLFFADGMLTCRMYETWEQFRNGWKRIYIESAKCKVRRLQKASWVVALFGWILPIIAGCNLVVSLVLQNVSIASATTETYREVQTWGAAGLWLSLGGLVAYAAALIGAYRVGRVPLWAIPGFVVGSWCVSGILGEAARDLK